MTAISVSAPFPILTDIDGSPLDAGHVYIGQPNLDPVAFPKSVYWDASLTTPAAQPIRTTGGYPVRNGSPARIYTDGDYSIRINNKNGTLVYSSPASTDRLDSWQIGYDGGTVQDVLDAVTGPTGAASVGYTPAGTGAVATNVQSKLRETVSVKDFGAVGDGVADDTAAIQAALNTGAGRISIPDGVYIIDAVSSPLQPASNQELILSANATLKAITSSAPSYSVILCEERENVIIRGGKILGDRSTHTGSTGEFGMGVRFNASKRCKIYDTEIEDCWGDGIYLGSDSGGLRKPCEKIELFGVKARKNRRNNLSVINSIGLRALLCDFDEASGASPQAGVDLEPNHVSEQITDTLFSLCTFRGNAGAGLMTAGPADISRDLTLIGCTFYNNNYGMSSGIANTQVLDCYADGSTNTTNVVGGFTVADGVIRGCKARNFRRTGFGATGAGNVIVESCETEYLGKNGGTEEDTFLYSTKTGGSLIVRNNPAARGRVQCIRADAGTVNYLEISGNTFERHHVGTFGTTYPLRIDALASTRDAVIKDNTFGIPSGTATDGVILFLNDNTNYVVAENTVKGWNRTRTNWYSQGVGTGSLRFGGGNVLPSGEYGREQSWQTGYLQLGAYFVWVDETGKMRIKSSAPASDTDGTVVGAQT